VLLVLAAFRTVHKTGEDSNITFRREELSFETKHFKGSESLGPTINFDIQQPTIKPTHRGGCVMYVNGNNHEIASLPKEQNTTYVLSMHGTNDVYGGGDGTVPDSSGSALKSVLDTVKLEGVEHQEAFGDVNAMRYIAKAVRNLALKRIKELR
jgi:hypothetical protein